MPELPLDANGHTYPVDRVLAVVARYRGAPFVCVDPMMRCAVCDVYPEYDIGPDAVRVTEPCMYPDGITTDITLTVTSGGIVVADDLRPVYDWANDGLASYNTALGQSQVIKAMAAIGCAYGPVGNSCPGLYRTRDPGRYVIANPPYTEDDDNDVAVVFPEYDKIAGICTDLWAYSIADYAHWVSRGGDPGKTKSTIMTVDFPNGVYRFVHHTGERGFDHYADSEVVFADITRVGDA